MTCAAGKGVENKGDIIVVADIEKDLRRLQSPAPRSCGWIASDDQPFDQIGARTWRKTLKVIEFLMAQDLNPSRM